MSDEKYYKILGVNANSSKKEIKEAYRNLAKLYHPDRNIGDSAAEEKFREINEAYSHLKNKAEDGKSSKKIHKPADVDRDHYSVLGVRKGASRQEIEKEYNKLMEQLMHDHNVLDVANRIKRIKEAYNAIKDEPPPDVW